MGLESEKHNNEITRHGSQDNRDGSGRGGVGVQRSPLLLLHTLENMHLRSFVHHYFCPKLAQILQALPRTVYPFNSQPLTVYQTSLQANADDNWTGLKL